MDTFLLKLFDKYAELLKRRFSDDFHEVRRPCEYRFLRSNIHKIVSTDDYMPMPIGKLDEYDKVVNVSWYTPDKPRDELQYYDTRVSGKYYG